TMMTRTSETGAADVTDQITGTTAATMAMTMVPDSGATTATTEETTTEAHAAGSTMMIATFSSVPVTASAIHGTAGQTAMMSHVADIRAGTTTAMSTMTISFSVPEGK